MVSILVFLELALGQHLQFGHCRQSLGFNPCFLGTCPRTLAKIEDKQAECVFQSLFSWNLPSDFERQCFRFDRISFNPCFLGTCPRTATSRPSSIRAASFNPCFLGTCPRTMSKVIFHEVWIEFQSLFSWNLPSDHIHIGYWLDHWRVSILVFLELALGRRTGHILDRLRGVSILVFLELALGRFPCHFRRLCDGVSILVFLELALGQDDCDIIAGYRYWVSILVFLELALGPAR